MNANTLGAIGFAFLLAAVVVCLWPRRDGKSWHPWYREPFEGNGFARPEEDDPHRRHQVPPRQLPPAPVPPVAHTLKGENKPMQGLADWLRAQAAHPCASEVDSETWTAWAREVDVACGVTGRSTISRDTIAEWRALQGHGMTSAVGEYTPAEFWVLLDAYEAIAHGVAPSRGGER